MHFTLRLDLPLSSFLSSPASYSHRFGEPFPITSERMSCMKPNVVVLRLVFQIPARLTLFVDLSRTITPTIDALSVLFFLGDYRSNLSRIVRACRKQLTKCRRQHSSSVEYLAPHGLQFSSAFMRSASSPISSSYNVRSQATGGSMRFSF